MIFHAATDADDRVADLKTGVQPQLAFCASVSVTAFLWAGRAMRLAYDCEVAARHVETEGCKFS
jgi:hypothetical protein